MPQSTTFPWISSGLAKSELRYELCRKQRFPYLAEEVCANCHLPAAEGPWLGLPELGVGLLGGKRLFWRPCTCSSTAQLLILILLLPWVAQGGKHVAHSCRCSVLCLHFDAILLDSKGGGKSCPPRWAGRSPSGLGHPHPHQLWVVLVRMESPGADWVTPESPFPASYPLWINGVFDGHKVPRCAMPGRRVPSCALRRTGKPRFLAARSDALSPQVPPWLFLSPRAPADPVSALSCSSRAVQQRAGSRDAWVCLL